MIHLVHCIHPGANFFREGPEKKYLFRLSEKLIRFLSVRKFSCKIGRSVRQKLIPGHQMGLVPGICFHEIHRGGMRNIKAQWIKRVLNRLEKAGQIIRSHGNEFIIKLSILGRTFGLNGRIYLESTNIQRCDQARIIFERYLRAIWPSDEVWGSHSLSINEVQPDTTPTDTIRFSTIQAYPHSFITL